jgi:2-keto-4-pentenoate hydratase
MIMTTILTEAEAKDMARALLDARASGVPITAFTQTRPELGLDDGYAIQTELVSLLLESGETICGYKLGLTSKPMQEMLKVHQPDFGPVFTSVMHQDGAELSASGLIAPRIEAEIAVVLDKDLRGPDCTPAMVREATRGLSASMEIVDSRISDWKITICDTVADLASCAAIAMSSQVVPLEGIDPREIGMVMTKNGQVVGTGAGAAAMGDPLAAVAWLVNVLHERGVFLSAGSIVMTGALHAMVPFEPGDVFRAEFEHLGPITLTVVD